MHRRFHALRAALIALPLLAGGCTQMTRHSNMVVFGTNTVIGVRVGTAATQVPSIDIGYTRQEAVLMPLVANTATKTTTTTSTGADGKTVTTAESTTLAPCDMGNDVKVVAGTPAPAGNDLPRFALHPCLLVASNEREGAKDSYSVLASFGASFGGSSTTGEAKAEGGLAQYFATGMAAQLLALNGGASVVATGRAAEQKASNPPMTLGGVSAATVATAQAAGADAAKTYPDFQKALLDDINAAPTDAAVQGSMTKLEQDAGIKATPIQAKCATKSACIQAITDGDYMQVYAMHSAALVGALKKW